MVTVRVQHEAFDTGAVLTEFTNGAAGAGAVVSFTGLVRDVQGTLARMEIEHYPGMTERAIAKIAEDATARWSLDAALVLHRYGTLHTGDPIMMVATASRHRGDAFAAAEYLMDYLKSRAPFWKKEVTGQGADWVAAKDDDEDALSRW